ncbi:MAG: pyruvate, phosphate dikinase [Deltaproteobacteria bacterium RIFCSPLOWO2_12_FULL_40_28]|nr:MAG: pyruvate, phosphate dikinase [Deltaproteobacteria bacterium RIFCSPHIGHO2_02_FULL_40_28]OGQ20056.1 MAG: pyruvate, phosphate dikinase [Deltaproteobacteria bacterium RIFCSPHIGHO2_12_FULL_40_32]OGQ40623.1 MAG: pyruvate, phosphate dikinase [Deltaproteobacteria bacterium RIFCSPLOWO2_02_FULL_40_36]OGQ54292.1 MAG: pyruvate, phosphate dikinase [Deltaproteobacteria bacterium RIFCSPLOWO2_12_FULL_40_28]
MKARKKYVYFFGNKKADGKAVMKNLLGGKGANLAEMTNLGIPVPAGFTITTEVCAEYYRNNKKYPSGLRDQVEKNLALVEKTMGATFGSDTNPLLVSVRSGAPVSMPGMMDTILNLGLNDRVVLGIIKKTRDERFAYDSYRRFVQMYANVVMKMNISKLEHLLEEKKHQKGITLDNEMTALDWKDLVYAFKAKIKEYTGKDFPDDPREQLWGAIGAVFNSWMTKRAIEYRRINTISEDLGTAVNVQSMVYGNMGNDSATGVAFTRDPSTGEKVFFGEYLINAQGEDVVAGIRTPQPINIAAKKRSGVNLPSMEETLPKCYRELVSIYKTLEKHYRDMQDIEFTIQQGKLWMLQTRNGKRTAQAAIKIAVDMVREKMIRQEEGILRVQPNQLDQLLHPQLDPKASKHVIAKGLPASPGAVTGQVVFTADEAVAKTGLNKVILVRAETSPEDIHGMHVSEGILTARGGMTSHAAVVARGMGKCCVAGCGEIVIDVTSKTFKARNNLIIKEGDWITLDGSTGEVMLGQVETVEAELSGDFGTLMRWVDGHRKLNVRTNADTPHDAKVARKFGAEGIGLCRTEHMFFDAERIEAVREMILSPDQAGRAKALAKILPMQKQDFKGIFREMKNLPVTIRLLDPPLHEFLPHTDQELENLSQSMGIPVQLLKEKNESLKEFNPMLGHRGCRLGITFPEIYDMQVRAIMEAACELVKEEGFKIIPEIMIPLVGHVNELALMRKNAIAVCNAVMESMRVKIKYLIGTMIELPRAALTADAIAKEAEFFSFGTNDLTQTTYGLSRDDAAKFLPFYIENHILSEDPFVSIDVEGVGALMKMSKEKGKKVNRNLKLGICGEHGGDPASVTFCHSIGLDYVSCSPYRIPIARLAAAQAAIKDKKSSKAKQ